MIVVLAFLVFVVPAVTAALSFASTASTISGAQTRSTIAQYTSTGGTEHGLYRIVHEAGYADGLVLDASDLYTVLINGRTVNVSVTKLSATVHDPPSSTYSVTVDELASAILLLEAAPVDVLGPIWIEATDGNATASTLVWTRDGYYEVTAWVLEGL